MMPPLEPSRLKSIHIWTIVLILVAIALLTSGIELFISYNSTLQKALAQAQTTSYLVSEWLNASFATPQHILKNVVQSIDPAEIKYPADNPSQHLKRTEQLIDQTKLYQKIHFLGIFDRNCTVTHTSIGVNLGKNFRQREYCALVFQEPLEAFKMSNMFRSVTDHLNITVSYPILGPSRDIVGFAVAGIDLSFFQRWLNEFALEKGLVVSVLDSKQQILARTPLIPDAIGKRLDDSTLDRFIKSPDLMMQTVQLDSPIDQTNRVWTIQRVKNSPFIVVAGITTDSVLSAWWVKFAFYLIGNIILGAAIAFGARELIDNRKLAKVMQMIANTDELTGLANRRRFIEVLQHRIAEANRYQQVFSILLIDIDYFKQINDRHGHDVGDRVLRIFAETIQRQIRTNDTVARWGGEEFIVILPHTDRCMAVQFGERLLAKMAEISANSDMRKLEIILTASLGISEYQASETMNAVIKRADEALYRAKDQGRNRLEVS